MIIFYDVLFLLVILLAAGFDFRERRIPNTISFSMFFPIIGKTVTKITLHSGNWERLKWLCIDMAGGIAIALLLTGIPFLINRSMGGGDMKLTSFSGWYAGAQGSLTILFTAFLLCAMTALFIMVIKRRKISTMPFAPFILVGTIHFLLFAYLP